MPPRIPRVPISPSTISRISIAPKFQQICPICSISRSLRPKLSRRRPTSRSQYWPRSRQQSNEASASVSNGSSPVHYSKSRAELREALADLKKHAGSYVNISKLQLALRGLDQPQGQETIRIALLLLKDPGNGPRDALDTIKSLLRLLLADPLKAEEDWEQTLLKGDLQSKPILVKVGHNGTEGVALNNSLVQELNVSSPMLNGHKLQILLLDVDAPTNGVGGISRDEHWTDRLLVPTLEIPTSSTGRHTSVTTPVHKALVVADGFYGGSIIQQYQHELGLGPFATAVNLRSFRPEDVESLGFNVVDIEKATAALQSFRQSVDNAISYEQDWFASGISHQLDFLKDGTASTDKSMKEALRSLVQMLLTDANGSIVLEEGRRRRAADSARMSPSKAEALRQGLSEWAERAHTELRDSLDIAFNGRRWRTLGWWKLFWRVDDVSMIATDILNQRFLTDAEREVIYLAGVIDEALSKDPPVTLDKDWAYEPVVEQHKTGILIHAPPPKLRDLIEAKDDSPPRIKPQPWPLEIPTARAFLAADTIPALQALAQKLVLQTLTTSTFSSAFAGLIYVSTLSTSLYEAGAVAALGIVWSLRRMQGKWETARKFWEGEVREEGRKAVRGVESVVMNALVQPERPLEGAEERSRATEALEKAKTAFDACK